MLAPSSHSTTGRWSTTVQPARSNSFSLCSPSIQLPLKNTSTKLINGLEQRKATMRTSLSLIGNTPRALRTTQQRHRLHQRARIAPGQWRAPALNYGGYWKRDAFAFGLPRRHLRHAAPHVLKQRVGSVYVVTLAGAQMNRRLVVPVEIRAAGFDQLELGGQFLVKRGVFRAVLAVVDLQALQAVVDEGAQQLFERYPVTLGQAHGMRQRGQAAAVADAPHAFDQFRFIALHRGRGVVGQVAVEGFLVGLHIAFAQQHLGEMRSPGEVLAEHLHFLKRDLDAERVQLGDELAVAFAAALLVAPNPLPESR